MLHEMVEACGDTGIAEQEAFIYNSNLPAQFMDIQSHAKWLVGK